VTDAICYRNLESPWGTMIGGATRNGACFLEWHDRGGVETILRRVARRYRCEPLPGDNAHLTRLEAELEEYFRGERREFTVSIDVTGTPFERRVWDVLLGIPCGATCSYGEIAASLGKPTASRAVGRANGANYLAILIPCHRVIEASGALRGYGGGLWRKRRLLELEGALPPSPAN